MIEIRTEETIIRVYSPDITEDKALQRKKQLQKATQDLLKTYGRRAKK